MRRNVSKCAVCGDNVCRARARPRRRAFVRTAHNSIHHHLFPLINGVRKWKTCLDLGKTIMPSSSSVHCHLTLALLVRALFLHSTAGHRHYSLLAALAAPFMVPCVSATCSISRVCYLCPPSRLLEDDACLPVIVAVAIIAAAHRHHSSNNRLKECLRRRFHTSVFLSFAYSAS